ncbi:MAG: BON domain-containing protein [Alphaproteobacteria bacterium]|nr:BON domain-containing protein [Alphaproteobacteria bacterium]
MRSGRRYGEEYGSRGSYSMSGSGSRGGESSGRRGMRNYSSEYGDRYSRDYGGRSAGEYGNYGQGGGYEGGGFGTYTRDYERNYGGGSYGGGEYGRGERNHGNRERGWWDRATDEVSSWFGDHDAERRREMDQQHRGRGPKNYTRSDDRIREDVSDRLTDDPLVDASEIDVTVQSQEVTLTGTVSSRNERRLAEETVESVSGVKYVQNNLRVKPRQSGNFGSSGSSSTSGGSSGSSGSGSSDLRSFGSGGTTTM